MPEIAAAHRAARRASAAPGRRLDLLLAGGAALVAVAGLVAYPYANVDEARSAVRDGERPGTRAAVVAIPTLWTVRQSLVTAPPLVEPMPIPATAAQVRRASPVVSPAETGPRIAPRPAPSLPMQVPPAAPVREAVVMGVEHTLRPPAHSIAAPNVVADRWQPLRDALDACAQSDGLWKRATCAQGARLAHCDDYWGDAALCPGGRTEFGQ